MLSLTFIHSDVLHRWPTFQKLLHKFARLSSINYSTSDCNVVFARKNTKTPFADQRHDFFKDEIDSDIYVIFLHSSMYSYKRSAKNIYFILFIFQFMHSCFQRWVSMWWNISKHLPTVVSCSINKNSIIVISVLGYDTNADLRSLHFYKL